MTYFAQDQQTLQAEQNLRSSLRGLGDSDLDLSAPAAQRFSFQPDSEDRWDPTATRRRSQSPRRRDSPTRQPVRSTRRRSSPAPRFSRRSPPFEPRRAWDRPLPAPPIYRRPHSPLRPFSGRAASPRRPVAVPEPFWPEDEQPLRVRRSEDREWFPWSEDRVRDRPVRSEDRRRWSRSEDLSAGQPPASAQPSAADPTQLDVFKAATAEAVQAAIVPLQQSWADFQKKQQEQALPALRKPYFAAVHSALQLLPSQAQLQPFYTALRAVDSIEPEDQCLQALQPLAKYCLDHPQASAQDIQQQAQLAVVGSNPFLSSILSASAQPALQPVLSLLAAGQSIPAQRPATSVPFSTKARCFRCGHPGHYASHCTQAIGIDNKVIEHGKLKFGPPDFLKTIGKPGPAE